MLAPFPHSLVLAVLAPWLPTTPLAAQSCDVSFAGVEIGSPGVAGSESCSSGVYTITGAGTGIYAGFTGAHLDDQGHLAQVPGSGDIEIVMRVVGLSGGPKSQVGIVLRETAGFRADMAFAVMQLAPSLGGDESYLSGYRRPEWHPGEGDPVDAAWFGTTPPAHSPVWIKLVSVGGNFAAFRSSDGLRWCPFSESSGGGFTPASYMAGIFVSGGASGASAMATIESLYVGPPRLEYKTSWVGNDFSNSLERYVTGVVHSMWVSPDGRVYTNAFYEEAGEATRIYTTDGDIQDSIFYRLAGFGGGGATEGSLTGETGNLYIVYDLGLVGQHRVCRMDPDGAGRSPDFTFTSSFTKIGGLAAGGGMLYLSDIDSDRILVASTATRSEVGSFAFTRPGPMAIDSRGDIWIIQRATDYPISIDPVYPAAVRCYHPNGTFSGREITDVVNPTALCIDPTVDRLLVCENGPDQNIRIYTGLDTAPAHTSSFGVVGGMFGSGTPGLVNDLGNGGYARFSWPNGVGVDLAGNIYVSSGSIGTDLRKFDAGGNLLWQRSGHPFTQCSDFDPTTDGEDMYGVRAHYALDYSEIEPGKEWSFVGQGHNPLGPSGPIGFGFSGAIVRSFGPGNPRFLFQSGNDSFTHVFRYDGEELIPCGRMSHAAADRDQWWIDLDGDRVESPSELSTVLAPSGSMTGARVSTDVAENGDVSHLHAFYAASQAGSGYVRHYRMLGLTPEGVPMYGVGSGEHEEIRVPPELVYALRHDYDQANDVMVLLGSDVADPAFGGLKLACWDDWSQPTRSLRWVRYLSTPETSPDFLHFAPYPSPEGFLYFAMDAAGDKVFLGELWGPIHVYDRSLGNEVIRLNPGPEVSGVMGWTDIWHGVRAFERSSGEFAVTREDAGIRSRNLLFRWTPEALARPEPPTNLASEGGSDAIRLTWNGPYGVVRSYSVWRRLAPGAEILVASNVTLPVYEDTTVQHGVAYHYRITAENEAGVSDPSDEVVERADARAVFQRIDSTTKGDWRGVYGSEGYKIVADGQSFPPDIDYSIVGHNPPFPPAENIWSTDTTQPRALQNVAGTGRIASYWHDTNVQDPPFITIDLDLTDGEPKKVALYFLDWDSQNLREVEVRVYDALGRLLSTQQVADYRPGKYAVWMMKGRVRIELEDIAGVALGAAGLFIDPFRKAGHVLRR
jgi:hypothetical protein